MRYLYVPLLLTLAACQSSVPFDPVADRCGSLQYLSQVGTKADDIKPGTFPEGTRMIRPGTLVTRDLREDRLNVHINEKGRITKLDCG